MSRDVETLSHNFTQKTDESFVENWILERTQRPIALEKRIFDSVLLKLDNGRYLWFLNIHHLVTDAASNAILYRRMASLYTEALTGKIKVTEEEQNSFQNYVRFEELQQKDTENESYRTYWREKTAEVLEKPKLYGEKAKKPSTAAKRIVLNLGDARSSKLRELAKRPEIRGWTEDLTIFNMLSTLYFIFLYRVS